MKNLLVLVILVSFNALQSYFICQKHSRMAAESFLQNSYGNTLYEITGEPEFHENLFYLYSLNPSGFILVSARTKLEPILGYSFVNNFANDRNQKNKIFDILGYYIQNKSLVITEEEVQRNSSKWDNINSRNDDFQQWPPEGTTLTGGWLETNWNQTHPFNSMCPLDPLTGSRSVAGCPSVAVSQIINFHKTVNNTNLNEGDRYRMFFSGQNNYYIDDDAAARDFPTFDELNGYLDEISYLYDNHQELNNQQKAALIFSSGIAVKQAYSSAVSGNYFNPQIVNAYHRFGFLDSVTLFEDSPMLQERMIQNMKKALPAQLSLLTNDGSGHQVVLDGYNTDHYFHMNFGWGGLSNGWYSFPFFAMPYQLNIFGSVVIDINQTWEDCPDFSFSITNYNQPMKDNFINYHIETSGPGPYKYFVYLNGELIRQTDAPGSYFFDLSGYENGFYTLTIYALDLDNNIRGLDETFEISWGEIVFSENFDGNWLDYWSVESTMSEYTWQSINNSFESFSNINCNNISSATCPTAYSFLDESLISPLIELPKSEHLELLFYSAYSDMYLQYPNVKLDISSDYGNTWSNIWQASVPGDDWGWHRVSINLTEFSEQSIKLRFKAVGFSYCDVSIDHVIISDLKTLSNEMEAVTLELKPIIYPNPFYVASSSQRTTLSTISFELAKNSNVKIEVYDIRGRKHKVLHNGALEKGSQSIVWNGLSSSSYRLSSGIYFIRIITDYTETVQKIMLLR